MKKFFFISIVYVLLVGVVFTGHANFQMKMRGPVERIHLLGELKKPDKGTGSQPVEVYQNENDLELYFLSSLNSLTIKVVNEQDQTVYQKTVNVAAGSSLIIDLQGWASGAYTLSITDGQGGSLEGIFEIE